MRTARAIALSVTANVGMEAARLIIIYGCALALALAGRKLPL